MKETLKSNEYWLQKLLQSNITALILWLTKLCLSRPNKISITHLTDINNIFTSSQQKWGLKTNNTIEKFEKNLKDIHWCSATCNCIKNDWLFLGYFRSCHLNVFEKWHRKFLGKTLPLAWLIHNTITYHHKQFFVINYIKIICYEKQPFSSIFKHFLKIFTVSPHGTFSIKDNMY